MTFRGSQLREESVQTLFQEAKRRAHVDLIDSYEEYRDLVEDLLQEKVNDGTFDLGEDIPTIQKDLDMMWPEIERGLR